MNEITHDKGVLLLESDKNYNHLHIKLHINTSTILQMNLQVFTDPLESIAMHLLKVSRRAVRNAKH